MKPWLAACVQAGACCDGVERRALCVPAVSLDAQSIGDTLKATQPELTWGFRKTFDQVNKNFQQNLAYTFDLEVYLEKFNMLVITNGMGGLEFTR